MKLPQIRPVWGPLSPLGAAVAAAGFLTDRLSKWWLLDVYEIAGRGLVEVTPFFNLVLAWNTGVSYGLFSAETWAGRSILIGFAVLVTSALGLWLARVGRPLMAVSLGLVIGGAVGNIYDRIKFGAVADFFSFHIGDVFYWYIFNVADVWIVLGVALMLYDAFFPQGGKPGNPGGGTK